MIYTCERVPMLTYTQFVRIGMHLSAHKLANYNIVLRDDIAQLHTCSHITAQSVCVSGCSLSPAQYNEITASN